MSPFGKLDLRDLWTSTKEGLVVGIAAIVVWLTQTQIPALQEAGAVTGLLIAGVLLMVGKTAISWLSDTRPTEAEIQKLTANKRE